MEKNSAVIKPVAHIYTDFKEKFGIPRQSGLSPSSRGKIVFEPEYRNPDAIRGIDGFSHLWLIFDFSECHTDGCSLTVRPPRRSIRKPLAVPAEQPRSVLGQTCRRRKNRNRRHCALGRRRGPFRRHSDL